MPRAPRHASPIGRAALLLAACASLACSGTSDLRPSLLTGPAATLGHGAIRSWVSLDAAGTPTALGFAFDEAALTGLPTAADSMVMMRLPLPDAARGMLPFDHLEVDWNPQGHPPAPYQVPHFDFHFYKITNAQQDAIVPSDPQYDAKMAKAPPADEMPAGYVQTPGGVPRMGAHWVDPTSPELNGQPFTSTLIYGSWDGATTFVEPMVALSYLQSHPNVTLPVKQPARAVPAGLYPTAYEISYDATAKEYRVSLLGLTARGG